ncbi:MAG TPA: hypothetical protein VFX28_05100 [Methylomirabilota bacterium]|nr:hypothetical protein [Methylomirabilota bacterium]
MTLRTMVGGRVLPVVWLAVIALLVLGHICALPVQAHVEPLAVPGGEAAGHGSDAEHHAAASSCEATVTRPASAASGGVDLVALADVVRVVVGPAVARCRGTEAPSACRAPAARPLFLLHASLLI